MIATNRLFNAVKKTEPIPASKPRTLVCIPCYNSEQTIIETVRSVLVNSDADILLVDDQSDQPLIDIINREIPQEPRIKVVRPDRKVYAGGGKNLGFQRCREEAYDFAFMMDSDIVLLPGTFDRMLNYLKVSGEVVVGSSILPNGNCLQYSDTLINFSKYLPEPSREISWKDYLAGYAFAVNMKEFERSPCCMPNSIGGDDVVFFKLLKENFAIDRFPLLNDAAVIHNPPRTTLKKAVRTQNRYGSAFFSHREDPRNLLANKIPLLHLLTPRFLMMSWRMLRRGRVKDLRYAPVCWYLDFRRSIRILHLQLVGFEFPKYLPSGEQVTAGS